ncbi:MAG: cytochrome C biogenesis protein CcdA [Syntrophus sp. (in: bacteria)]|nr:cytochrome C biogenesis protein CcdA [Syntrophus sp. (in: bacteria)]
MEEVIQVTTTGDNKEIVKKIGRHLVEMRLASCVQIIGPITSIYWWKDKVEETEEWLCIIKSRQSLYEAIEREIVRLHTYELPEIIALKIEKGLPGYMKWVVDETVSRE